MEIIDGAALFGAGAVAFALKAYLHLANGVAHRARHLVASIVLHRLELVFRERVEHAGLMGKILVNALHRECGYWVIRQPGRVALVRLTTLGKPDCFLLCLNQLTKPAYGAQPEHDRVGFDIAVLCLLGVGTHRHRGVEDVLDFVDAHSFGQRAAGGVVMQKRW